MTDRFVAKRYLNIVYMLLTAFAGTALVALLHGKYLDELVVYLVADVVFILLFWFMLEHDRLLGRISANRETTFHKIMNAYLVCWILAVVSSFLPEFVKPMLAVPLIMAAFGTQSLAICTGVFLNVILCLALGSSIQELALYMLLALFGGMIAEEFKDKRYQLWYEIIVAAVSIMFPALFYYLAYREIKTTLLLAGALEGIVFAFAMHLFYRRVLITVEEEIPDLLEDMLDDSYALRRELRSFSKADFNHAKRVSAISEKCAGFVGADEKLCAVAGFYYRIGILEGNSIVTNGIHIAQRECFPEKVTRIISEYNGEQELPSTIESAIVHMVDGLIKKIEVFDSDMMSSDWNQNMVIYQTLNDFSAQGLYDKSGLTMNMFLKIREYLVNEEALL